MYNGGEGALTYWDSTYVPCNGACTTTSAWLSGGTGLLTDGFSPPLDWDQYGNNPPWVGWYTGYAHEANPTITFYFGSTVTVQSVTVWVANTRPNSDVDLPASVSVGGNNFTIARDPNNLAPRGYTFSGLDLTGNSVDVQFFQASPAPWLMVGEVSFDGASGVPEPATWALMAGGLALALLRRRLAF
jgi:hypothetical protein